MHKKINEVWTFLGQSAFSLASSFGFSG